ncbi:MAG: SNF2 helicase-associated domain-containing protein, partial [Planctomycetota bacterium]
MASGIDLRLTPRGRLLAGMSDTAPPLPRVVADLVIESFATGNGAGLWALGSEVVGTALPMPWSWWRDLAVSFVSAVCLHGEAAAHTPIEPPDAGERQRLCWSVPPMRGAEYLDDALLLQLWHELDAAFKSCVASQGQGSVDALLQQCHRSWHLVGRIHVHLAENRKDERYPFAFLVTYAAGLGSRGTARHLPLAQALQEYAHDRERLVALLEPLSIAARDCPWLQTLLDSKEIFHPLRWTADEALRFLRDTDTLRRAGVIARLPAAWRAQRPKRVQVSGTVGTKPPSQVGTDALLDFHAAVAIDGEPLQEDEIRGLLAGSDGLQLIRGRWVEVDRERLQRTLEHFDRIRERAHSDGLSFHEAMRLLAGDATSNDDAEAQTQEWGALNAGEWLAATLQELRRPGAVAEAPPGLRAHLRPYQREGLRWLHLLSGLRLGACLADDMGLGKTIQVLALLLK